MLEDLLYTRVLIKNELKQVSAQLASGEGSLSGKVRRQLKRLKRQLDVCQLGLKLIANVTYGYTSANFTGRMPCIDIADSIVSKGREALEQAILFINEWGESSGTGAKVVYGDTDSVFVSFPRSTLSEAFKLSGEIVTEITKRNPWPMGIKLEKIYQPCFLLSKKVCCLVLLKNILTIIFFGSDTAAMHLSHQMKSLFITQRASRQSAVTIVKHLPRYCESAFNFCLSMTVTYLTSNPTFSGRFERFSTVA